jgi:ABC-type transport system substrate-binding protein
LTADDVKATYARLIGPPQGFSSPRTPLFAAVSAINVRDAQTIEFELREPRPHDFMLGAFASGWNCIVRKKTLEEHNYNLRQVMNFPGTGPFRHKNASIKSSWSSVTLITGTRACPTWMASVLSSSALLCRYGRRAAGC